ncbi:uncharacterized protein LOC119364229 [Triticum dicoccoides]|uniref:uncharacterized protein LOC119364229 n=1 Tax=Triticum dicoccoides TaxID=85692 RepID=UPI00188ECDBF|nr:uncharacterized protein LOC119364229 [Triticum dicoccoides]
MHCIPSHLFSRSIFPSHPKRRSQCEASKVAGAPTFHRSEAPPPDLVPSPSPFADVKPSRWSRDLERLARSLLCTPASRVRLRLATGGLSPASPSADSSFLLQIGSHGRFCMYLQIGSSHLQSVIAQRGDQKTSERHRIVFSHLFLDCGLISKKQRGFFAKTPMTYDQKHSVLY